MNDRLAFVKRYLRLIRPALTAIAAGMVAGFALWDHDHPPYFFRWLQTGDIYQYHTQQLYIYALAGAGAALLLWIVSIRGRLNEEDLQLRTTFWEPENFHPMLVAARDQTRGFYPLFLMPLILIRYEWEPLGMGVGSSFWTYLLVPPLAITLAAGIAPLLGGARSRGIRPFLARWKQVSLPRLVMVVIALYVLVFGGLSIARHVSYQSHALDLGTMSQTIWNTSHGRLFEYTPLIEEATTDTPPVASRLTSGKFELIFLAIAPLYRLIPSPIILLVLQTLALGLSAWPLFLTLEKVLGNARTAAIIAIAYLAYLPLHYVNMADFHPSALIPFFLSWAVYAITFNRSWLYVLAGVGALLCRVDAAFVLAGFGLLLILREETAWGIITLAAGVGWFVLDFFVVVPWAEAQYGPDPYGLVSSRFGQYGAGPLDIMVGLAQQPLDVLRLLTEREKVQTAFDLLLPIGALPLAAPFWLLPALPLVVINLLADSAWQGTVQAHYFAPVLPILWIAAGIAIQRISIRRRDPARWRDGLALYALFSTLLVAFFFSPFPLGRDFHLHTYWSWSPHHEAIQQTLHRVAPESRLSGQSNILPHIAHRQQLHLFPSGTDSADQILVDLDNAAERAPLDYFAFFDMVDALVDNPTYGMVTWENGVVLFERGAPNSAARVRDLRAQYEVNLYRVEWLDHSAPQEMNAGELYMIDVCFENTGSQGLRSEDWYPTFLSYHWLTAGGDVVEWDGERARFPFTVYPEQQVCLDVPVVVPEAAGDYELQFDLVREHQYWFSQQGVEPLSVPVDVR